MTYQDYIAQHSDTHILTVLGRDENEVRILMRGKYTSHRGNRTYYVVSFVEQTLSDRVEFFGNDKSAAMQYILEDLMTCYDLLE